jgi:hypothetical protein
LAGFPCRGAGLKEVEFADPSAACEGCMRTIGFDADAHLRAPLQHGGAAVVKIGTNLVETHSFVALVCLPRV